ncbi:MAG: flagellar hook protein FlgE [candidate division FCPU426 bacterium]
MGALGTAITGLQSSQKWLDVISNNVSNSQTVAFKAGRLSFSDLLSTGLINASSGNNDLNLGGINPSQIGLGVTVSTVQTMMNQGATQITGNVTDLAIQGAGFFTVKSGTEMLYTRAGNLTFDNYGNLVTSDGGLVQGWSLTSGLRTSLAGPPVALATITDSTLDTSNTSAIGKITIPGDLVMVPSATSFNVLPSVKTEGAVFSGNLDSNTPLNANAAAANQYNIPGAVPDASSTFVVYDSLGTPYTMLLSFWQAAATPTASAQWNWTVNDVTGGVAPNMILWGTPATVGPPATPLGNYVGGSGGAAAYGPITFNADGSLANDNAVTPGDNPLLGFAPTNGALALTFSMNFGTDNTAAGAAGYLPPLGLRDGLTGDYGNGSYDTLGVYQPVQTVVTEFVDGNAEGTLNGLSFDQTGTINGSFSNGKTIAIAQLALTTFTNPGGLNKVGGNYYAASTASGTSQIGVAGQNGRGTIAAGALEESNVDLSVELTNMIVAQRMFESSARVVTTADKILEALINLGR